jgi:hypothetical protein
MNPALLTLALALPLLTTPQTADPMQTPRQLAHISTTFSFQLAAPLARVAPLFGPEGERCWAGKDWDPHFLYPQPARDSQGAVFTVQHGPRTSIWVNTAYDLAAGRLQYVAVLPDAFLNVIDVRLTSIDASHTAVEVTYTRTALAPVANEDVTAMGNTDRDKGPHWQTRIEACLNPQSGPAAASHQP